MGFDAVADAKARVSAHTNRERLPLAGQDGGRLKSPDNVSQTVPSKRTSFSPAKPLEQRPPVVAGFERSRVGLADVSRGQAVAKMVSRQSSAATKIASTDKSPAIQSTSEVQAILSNTIDKRFPSLQGVSVRLEPLNAKHDFFQSRPDIGTLLTPWRDTEYIVYVNPRIFTMNLSQDAVEAILAHELLHTEHYREDGLLGMLWALLAQIFSSVEVSYERGLDIRAIERGYGPGLKSYRHWLYQNLSGDAVAGKKKNYLTPEEITLVEQTLRERPELLPQWREDPPKNLGEFQQRSRR